MVKPGRYANGALISSAKKAMQGKKAIKIRQDADNLRNALKSKGIKKPGPDYEAGHDVNGKGNHGWEKIAKNRAVEAKNSKKSKLKIVKHHV